MQPHTRKGRRGRDDRREASRIIAHTAWLAWPRIAWNGNVTETSALAALLGARLGRLNPGTYATRLAWDATGPRVADVVQVDASGMAAARRALARSRGRAVRGALSSVLGRPAGPWVAWLHRRLDARPLLLDGDPVQLEYILAGGRGRVDLARLDVAVDDLIADRGERRSRVQAMVAAACADADPLARTDPHWFKLFSAFLRHALEQAGHRKTKPRKEPDVIALVTRWLLGTSIQGVVDRAGQLPVRLSDGVKHVLRAELRQVADPIDPLPARVATARLVALHGPDVLDDVVAWLRAVQHGVAPDDQLAVFAAQLDLPALGLAHLGRHGDVLLKLARKDDPPLARAVRTRANALVKGGVSVDIDAVWLDAIDGPAHLGRLATVPEQLRKKKVDRAHWMRLAMQPRMLRAHIDAALAFDGKSKDAMKRVRELGWHDVCGVPGLVRALVRCETSRYQAERYAEHWIEAGRGDEAVALVDALSAGGGPDGWVYDDVLDFVAVVARDAEHAVALLKATESSSDQLEGLGDVWKAVPMLHDVARRGVADHLGRVLDVIELARIAWTLPDGRVLLRGWSWPEGDPLQRIVALRGEMPKRLRKILDRPEQLLATARRVPAQAERLRARVADTEGMAAWIARDLAKAIPAQLVAAELDTLEASLVRVIGQHWKKVLGRRLDVRDADWRNAVALYAYTDANRRLLRRLLRDRADGADTRLRHPVNAAFVTAQRAAGRDPGPLLRPQELTMPGTGLVVRTAEDPLQVLQMGNHFDTCLSVRGCNSFSTVANALEVNKRVLYVYDGDKVVGRKLVVFSKTGLLVGFRTYGWSTDPWVKLLCDLLCLRWVRQTGFRFPDADAAQRLAWGGEDELVLFARWYHDGAEAPDPWVLALANEGDAAVAARLKVGDEALGTQEVRERALLWLGSR